MIGYDRLGSNGRLGNQMFQYAGLRGIAAKRGYDWCIPPENYQHRDNYGLFETFEMTNVKESNLGFVSGNVVQENDGWTIRTRDRAPSAHFEHTVAIFEDKTEILTTHKYIEESLKEVWQSNLQ